MTSDAAAPPARFRVVLRLRAPRPVTTALAAQVAVLLQGSPVWSSVALLRTADELGVDVHAELVAADPGTALQVTVDEVRGLLGIDVRYLRWIAEVRTAHVERLA